MSFRPTVKIVEWLLTRESMNDDSSCICADTERADAFLDSIPQGRSSLELTVSILNPRALESMMRIGDLTRRRGQAVVPAWPPQVWTSAGSVFTQGHLGVL